MTPTFVVVPGEHVSVRARHEGVPYNFKFAKDGAVTWIMITEPFVLGIVTVNDEPTRTRVMRIVEGMDVNDPSRTDERFHLAEVIANILYFVYLYSIGDRALEWAFLYGGDLL